jgi:hypothetical protein
MDSISYLMHLQKSNLKIFFVNPGMYIFKNDKNKTRSFDSFNMLVISGLMSVDIEFLQKPVY